MDSMATVLTPDLELTLRTPLLCSMILRFKRFGIRLESLDAHGMISMRSLSLSGTILVFC